jgi:hypothetical protein
MTHNVARVTNLVGVFGNAVQFIFQTAFHMKKYQINSFYLIFLWFSCVNIKNKKIKTLF